MKTKRNQETHLQNAKERKKLPTRSTRISDCDTKTGTAKKNGEITRLKKTIELKGEMQKGSNMQGI